MRDIEKILQRNSIDDVNIPDKVENKIHYALNHLESKSSKINYLKRIIAAFVSTILALLGSVTVYAALGGTIGGKPIFEYAKSGIKFSDQYEEYKQEINGQNLKHNETTVTLASTIYEENYVLLEFSVKLTQEDYEYLRIGKYMIENEFIELKENETFKDLLIKEKEKGIVNTLYIGFNENLTNEFGGMNNIIINDKGYWTGRLQNVIKISDYEYKLYQMYFLTDKMTEGRDEISLTLKNNSIENRGDTGKNGGIANVAGNYRTFELDGEINVNISKSKISENTKIIIPENKISQYKNMVQKVEEIKITPLQIIAKVSIQINNVNHANFTNLLNKEAKVYNNNNGKELTAYTYELTEKFNYKGKEITEGDLYDIKGDATMEISEIIIIEKSDNVTGLNIVPIIEERIWTKESGYGNIDVTLNPMEISLNQ